LRIIDELGFVPLSKTGAVLVHEMISQRHARRFRLHPPHSSAALVQIGHPGSQTTFADLSATREEWNPDGPPRVTLRLSQENRA
jgi:hypothetical protein